MARKRRTRKTYVKERQTGIYDQIDRGRKLDVKRRAKAPGKRRAADGSTYYEYRVDRTDLDWDKPKTRKRRAKTTKKYGKIGAPGSTKRKRWMAKIRKMRK